MKSEVPRLGSYSQQWRTTFAIPASFADSTCTGPRRTGAHSAQFGAFRVEFAGVCPVVSVFSVISPVLALYRLRFGMSGMCGTVCARGGGENRESVLICLLFRYAPAYSPRLQPVGSRDAPCPTRPLTYEHAYEAGEVEMEIRVVGCLLFSLKTARYGSSASFRTAPPCGGPALTSMLLEVEVRNWCCALAGLWSCAIAGLTLVEAAP